MDLFDSAMQVEGTIRFDGVDTRQWRNVYALRKRIGVVFPLPVGLPLTVYDNVALASPASRAGLLSGGQQQRLTIARALSQDLELLMLDEFSIAVDPVTTMRIEDVLKELRGEIAIILVTNLVQQARRLADRTAFFLEGSCIEVGETDALFGGEVTDARTRDYIEGKFG